MWNCYTRINSFVYLILYIREMQYPNIPNKVSFRKVIYGFNVFLVISGISAGIVFINGESL